MSSRRKSRPVRRSDILNPIHPTPLNLGLQTPQDDDGHPPSEQSLSPTCDSAGESFAESNNNSPHDIEMNEQNGNENIKQWTNPPEGVYVIEPQGFSDDEGQGVNRSHQGQEQEQNIRKRMRGHLSDDELSPKVNLEGQEGVDLSVKRIKTDQSEANAHDLPHEQNEYVADDNGHHDNHESHDEANDDHENPSTVDLSDKMQRFEKLLLLLAQQRPLLEAMEEVELSHHEVVVLQQLKMQLIEKKNEQVIKEYENNLDQPTTQNDQSNEWSHDQNSNRPEYNAGDIQERYSNTPAVAAAMMASIVKATENNDANGEAIQNYFKSKMFPHMNSTSPSGQFDPDSVDSITAGTVSSGVGSIKKGTLNPTDFGEEVFDKYITKFSSRNSCLQPTCPHVNRDHFHCTDSDCNFQRFTNKSDVIRHYNMHKKRDNSLAHGFMRFSPTDDCSPQFGSCHLNGKSTHYHCLHTSCTKVYTSTSDVMTHENFHKKNQQFVSNGFQRYRATENCGANFCPFSTQRTTHFHCTRPDCNFTFKNKCDIEKHKAYHTRDDAYTRQGFKKFYKNEPCQFLNCAWNRTANHFHCLRKNCDYAFTSTSQMVSHKRKHDRQDLLGGGDMISSSSQPPPSSLPSTSSSNPEEPEVTAATPQQFTARPVFPFVRPQYLAVQSGSTSNSLSFLPSFLAARLLKRPTPQMGFEPSTSGNVPSTALFQEAARKVLASIPTTVAAAALPQPFQFSPKLDQNYQKSYQSSTPRQEVYHHRENEEKDKESYERPPPPYIEAQESKSPLPKKLNDEKVEHKSWPKMNPENFSNFNKVQASYHHTEPQKQQDDEVLNLSSKSNSSNNTPQLQESSSDYTSESILKYFRGLAPNECTMVACMFMERYHFHCIIQDCCATFTEKKSVMNHTKFHENFDKMGIDQPISPQFLSISYSEPPKPQTTDSPPPGYISLPLKSRNFDPKSESHRSIVLNRPEFNPKLDQPQGSDPNGFALENRAEHYDTHKIAIYDYLQRVVQSGKVNLQPFGQQPQSIDNNYVVLQNPTNLVGNAAGNVLGNTANKKLPEDGYLHVTAGTTCMRQDCKYMMQSHWHCTLNRCRYVCKSLGKAQNHRQAHDSLEAYAKAAKLCFKSYTVKKICPNHNCEFRLRSHYHCLKPGCNFVTIGTSKLPWHMKKHEKIARREASGFKYYTKKEQCGIYDCKYNGLFSHYHCIRAGCSFAFQYKHQMSTHVRKHLRRMLGGRNYEMGGPMDHSNVDSGDDSLPLIVDEADELEQKPHNSAADNNSMAGLQTYLTDPNLRSKLNPQQIAMLEHYKNGLIQNEALLADSNANDSQDEDDEEDEMLEEDNEVLDLRNNLTIDTDSNSSGLNETEETEDNQNFSQTFQENNNNAASLLPKPLPTQSDSDSQFFNFRLNKEVMEGFKRFDSSEDCLEELCPYRAKTGHYHCTRDGCGYRFTGRTHMFKHHQHHERVDSLVRDDFKRFKNIQDCGFEGCELCANSTHFHCLRCNFKCTDSAKVGTHRRQHLKADALEQSGFERIRGKEECNKGDCKYRQKSTSHFHCLQPGCNYSVVGLSGIELHANKHKRNLISSQENNNFPHFNCNTFADSSINQSHNIADSSSVAFTFPYMGSSRTNENQTSNGSSPVTDDRSSASPPFNPNPIVTSQFNPTFMSAPSNNNNEMTGSLNLTIQRERGNVTTPMQAGIGGFM